MKILNTEDLERLINKTFLQINNKYKIEDDVLLKDIKNILILKFKKFKNINNSKRSESAYNLFIKKQYKDIDLDETTEQSKKLQNEKFKICAKLWQNLGNEEKQVYIDEADKLKKTVPKSVKKPRKLTGYNLYYKEMNNKLKTQNSLGLPEEEKPKNISIMKYISQNWKNLSQEEKNIWINKASNI
jgi:hypothetical protein